MIIPGHLAKQILDDAFWTNAQSKALFEHAINNVRFHKGNRRLVSKADLQIVECEVLRMRREARRRGRICAHCKRHISEHPGGQCLFDAGRYKPAADMMNEIKAFAQAAHALLDIFGRP